MTDVIQTSSAIVTAPRCIMAGRLAGEYPFRTQTPETDAAQPREAVAWNRTLMRFLCVSQASSRIDKEAFHAAVGVRYVEFVTHAETLAVNP